MKEAIIGNGVTEICAGMFQDCGLTSVTIPNGFTTIANFAFSGCNNLVSVTVPASVTEIEISAFKGCHDLKNITVLNPTPPTIQDNTFDAMTELFATLQVPVGSKASYQQAPYWNNFAQIEEIEVLGIEQAAVDRQDKIEVYTLGGVRLPLTEAAQLQTLPKGIYIVNGQKQMIR